MIPGIVAQKIGGDIGASSEPFLTADFANGIYTYNDVVKSVSDFITDTDPTSIDANGLHIVGGASPVPIQIVGDLRDALHLYNWSMVMEMDIDPNGRALIFLVYTESGVYANSIEMNVDTYWQFQDFNSELAITRSLYNWTDGISDSIHKFGLTETPSMCAMSIDGSIAGASGSSPYDINNDAQTINVGANNVETHFGSNAHTDDISYYIRSLKLYAPLTTIGLATLTSL